MHLLRFIIVLYIIGVGLSAEQQTCLKDIYLAELYSEDNTGNFFDVLVIRIPVSGYVHKVAEFCSNKTGQIIKRPCFRKRPEDTTTAEPIAMVDCGSIINKCEAENLQHVYRTKSNMPQQYTIHWPAAEIGQQVTTKETCLLANGQLLTRKCVYSSETRVAQWQESHFKDSECLMDTKQTNDLNQLYNEVETKSNISTEDTITAATQLANILKTTTAERVPADVLLTNKILELLLKLNQNPKLLPITLEIMNAAMTSDEQAIRISHELQPAMSLVELVENYSDDITNKMVPTDKCSEYPNGVHNEITNHTSVYFINPSCSNISGIAVYDMTNMPDQSINVEDEQTETYVRYLYLNDTLDDKLDNPNFIMASHIPQDLWNKLQAEYATIEAVHFSLYRNPQYFADSQDGETSTTPTDVIVKASIPGYEGILPGYVKTVFKKKEKQGTPKCVEYKSNTWKSYDVSELSNQNVTICQSNDLSIFLSIESLIPTIPLVEKAILQTVKDSESKNTFIVAGCTITLVIHFAIWFAAMYCKKWHSKNSYWLLFNFRLILTLIMSYFLLIRLPEARGMLIKIDNCMAEGAFLQSSILILFLWILITARLQQRRFETALPKIYILAAWLLPIVYAAVAIWLEPQGYVTHCAVDSDCRGICLPSGSSLYCLLALLALITLATCHCIASSFQYSLKVLRDSRKGKNYIYQLLSSIILFLVLPASWSFGIWSYITKSVIVASCFCTTSLLGVIALNQYFASIDKSQAKLGESRKMESFEDNELKLLPVKMKSGGV